MKGTILLNANENTRKIEEEEKALFVKGVLETMGVPMDEIWNDSGDLSLENKIRLRSILATYGVMIVDNIEDLQMYVEEQGKEPQLIATWSKPTYVLKKDSKQLNPKKKLYLEMNINCWSVFENTE
jgi:hypothetical protein